jgi:hypothetical protein
LCRRHFAPSVLVNVGSLGSIGLVPPSVIVTHFLKEGISVQRLSMSPALNMWTNETLTFCCPSWSSLPMISTKNRSNADVMVDNGCGRASWSNLHRRNLQPFFPRRVSISLTKFVLPAAKERDITMSKRKYWCDSERGSALLCVHVRIERCTNVSDNTYQTH